MTKIISLKHKALSLSHYRQAGVFKYMEDVEFITTNTFDHDDLHGVDILFLYRPLNPDELGIIHLAKQMGVKVWVDYDDDPHNLPIHNPAHRTYWQDGLQRVVTECVKAADAVSVTTLTLKKHFAAIGAKWERVHIIPNAINDYVFKWQDYHRSPGKQKVIWRGSDTHAGDLMSIDSALKEYPGISWHFFGFAPWFTMQPFRKNPFKYEYRPFSNGLWQYFDDFAKAKPHWLICPLIDNKFNRSKSNIAWIEATWAGAAVIAPDLPEWKRPGVINYKNATHLEKVLSKVAAGHYNREELIEQPRENIEERYTLSKVNQKRKEVINALLAEKKETKVSSYAKKA